MANRAYERFTVDAPVLTRAPGADSTRELLLKDISRGGLFLETAEPYPQQSQLEVRLLLKDDLEIWLGGVVVHAVSQAQAEAWDGTAGIGIQFGALDSSKIEGLDVFLDIARGRIDDELAAAPFDTGLVTEVEAASRKGDLCKALKVEPQADSMQVLAAADARAEALSSLLQHEGLNPELTQRLIACRLAVQRARGVLADPGKRAGYLLRSGDLAPEDLAAQFAGEETAEQELARGWEHQNPAEVASARALAEQAREFAGRGDRERARDAAERALRQHPFLFELRRQIAAWSDGE